MHTYVSDISVTLSQSVCIGLMKIKKKYIYILIFHTSMDFEIELSQLVEIWKLPAALGIIFSQG